MYWCETHVTLLATTVGVFVTFDLLLPVCNQMNLQIKMNSYVCYVDRTFYLINCVSLPSVITNISTSVG